jgi:1,5-anhydro-D-fructose reductase (1,5-anhydro-D-mannitol-forming)
MVKVGIVGIGFMGKQHFGAYRTLKTAKVVALSDLDPKKLAGDWRAIAGNIADPRAAQVDLSGLHLHAPPAALFRDSDVDVVDITLPTFSHAKYAVAALEAGKHVICEKPMAITVAECERMIAAAKAAKRLLFIAHCIRFWPEYVVLKKLVDSGKYGRVLSARFWRMSATPRWSWDGWLLDEKRSGSAAVDLHIHDTDLVNYVFGVPKAVRSVGAVGAVSNTGVDSLTTQYIYGRGAEVVATGNWIAAPGFGFTHGFCVCLEKATVEFDLKSKVPLTVHPMAGPSVQPKLPKDDGYLAELRHFVNCIAAGKPSSVVTAEDARDALKVALAEVKSVKTGKPVVVG